MLLNHRILLFPCLSGLFFSFNPLTFEYQEAIMKFDSTFSPQMAVFLSECTQFLSVRISFHCVPGPFYHHLGWVSASGQVLPFDIYNWRKPPIILFVIPHQLVFPLNHVDFLCFQIKEEKVYWATLAG